MTLKSKDESLTQIHWDEYYHQRAWTQFTTLTQEERNNLRNRAKHFEKWKQKTGLLT